jgi:MFS family permease
MGDDVAQWVASYFRVLTLPGAWVFSVSGLCARMPIAMVNLGIVLFVSARTNSYGLAGAVAASFLIANASTGALQARLIDYLGQSRVLPTAIGVFSVGLIGMMGAVEAGWPPPWPHAFAVLAGTGLPPIGACVRARWSHLVTDKRDLHTAFAFESVVDELVFIIGPALVATMAAIVHPRAGLCLAVAASVAGTAVLVTHKQSEPPVTPTRGRGKQPPMPWPEMAPLLACAVTLGGLLGGVEVGTAAFADNLGSASRSGLMLAIWASGSLASAIVTGAVHPKAGNAARFRWGMIALGLSMVPLLFIDGFVALALFLLLSGFALSPTLIAAFAVLDEALPRARITEGIALFTAGLGAGSASGAALVGIVVDRSGAPGSFWVPVGVGLLGATLALSAGRHNDPSIAQPADRSRSQMNGTWTSVAAVRQPESEIQPAVGHSALLVDDNGSSG